jgi:hypothetical protein
MACPLTKTQPRTSNIEAAAAGTELMSIAAAR